MTTTKGQAAARLKRRADYLRSLDPTTGEANSYDLSEIAALDVAIPALADTPKKNMTAKRHRQLNTLQRRLDWLTASNPGPGDHTTLQEINALQFAIETITEHYLNRDNP